MTPPLTNADLDRLDALAEAATPGPWTVSLARTLLWVMAPLRAIVSLSVSPPRAPEAEIREEHVRRANADAAFIAAARLAIPALVAEVRRLRGVVPSRPPIGSRFGDLSPEQRAALPVGTVMEVTGRLKTKAGPDLWRFASSIWPDHTGDELADDNRILSYPPESP